MTLALLVDLGNTRLKWAIYDGATLQASSVLPHRNHNFQEVLVQAWSTIPRPHRVVVASVTELQRCQQLAAWVQAHWSVETEFIVSPAQGHGVKNSYDEPTQLGCDRWAAMVAAYHLTHSAVCVVDCGSAVTVDVVDANGQHLGGLILPGVQAMQAALTRHTTLASIHFTDSFVSLLGKSTEEGIRCGITRAISSLVQQTLSELTVSDKLYARCILTGGDAALVASALSIPYEIDRDLVLKGLAVMAFDP